MQAAVHTCVVSDQTAAGILKMAKRFFSDPANVEKYRAWHLKEYGCLPGTARKAGESNDKTHSTDLLKCDPPRGSK